MRVCVNKIFLLEIFPINHPIVFGPLPSRSCDPPSHLPIDLPTSRDRKSKSPPWLSVVLSADVHIHTEKTVILEIYPPTGFGPLPGRSWHAPFTYRSTYLPPVISEANSQNQPWLSMVFSVGLHTYTEKNSIMGWLGAGLGSWAWGV